MQKLIVILGPTASGKSDLAVKLAQKHNGEIISADSRQVYKGLDIGTGKITKKEMKGVKHHLIDVSDPRKRFTASDFMHLTNYAIAEIVKSGKLPIVCGGTGFYIDALLGDKQIPEVPPNPKLRAKLEKKTTRELFEILKKLDPERAETIEKQNPRRLIRAIEICEAIGKVPKFKSRSMNYEVCKIGIAPITPSPTPSSYNKRKGLRKPSLVVREGGVSYFFDENKLKARINKRIEKWFKMGLLKEVQNLHKKGLSWKRMAEIGLEYKIVSLFLQNKISKPEMIRRMQIETYQYAKRQMTWFKKDKSIIWLPPRIGLVEKEARKFL
ncbi:MAG: tRNA (adenosine(37)-N6)-dimethylallyltransferase MiaA [Candidatus Zambryskibacteria bacterium]